MLPLFIIPHNHRFLRFFQPYSGFITFTGKFVTTFYHVEYIDFLLISNSVAKTFLPNPWDQVN